MEATDKDEIKPDYSTKNFFSNWDNSEPVNSWASLNETINEIITISQNRRLCWRGQANADWPLYNTIYRDYKKNVAKPSEDVLETDIVSYESKINDYIRSEWRVDHIPYLELTARIRHFGGPSRLLDVSTNPFVAAWFAVEGSEFINNSPESDCDARVFAFDISDRVLELKPSWLTRDIPWLNQSGDETKDREDLTKWTSRLPLFWRPPAYNDRIPAQYSGFLLAGVPNTRKPGTPSDPQDRYQYVKGPGKNQHWLADQVRKATSIPVHLVQTGRKIQESTHFTLSFRISRKGKCDIRNHLENIIGINRKNLLPDVYGITEFLTLANKSGNISSII